jgi:hypothetical protein
MVAEHNVSVRRAGESVGLTRSAFYAPRRAKNDGPVIAAILRYVQENPGHGFDKLYPALKPQGFGKTVLYRVYRALRLNQKRRGKRRLPARVKSATADSGRTQRGLVGRLHGRRAVVGSTVPHVQRARGLQPRGAADRDRHEPAGSARRARA